MARGNKAIKYAVLGVLLATTVACTTRYRNHGYVPTPAELEEVKLGVDTRDTIAEAIGSPSATGMLSDSSYVYVRSKVKHYGARAPEVVERQVVAIDFDSRGVARNLQYYSLEDGQAVPLTRRITDNGIQSSGFLRQLLSNIGNFDPSTITSQ
ncbi:Beta-barrel assembly machine subunit BamE [Shimia isoporae]|uniref:Beta-barrel assembly machine subunit BamE n=1 Tax=Shimia isoporae TaxID=647720 RepID=A0A4R1NPC1_9RHOB|nr:outer membrane protein assembly factor BamE [Shimia isoporae]TCL09691.1 Beta-barrel assembly machine subunit BamE [Shimia isoporae]